MSKPRRMHPAVVAAYALLLAAAASHACAASPRTFVASTGNDANPCTRTLPCRSFATAIAQTTAGGEVIVLDSAGYGSVTIGTSVSIIAPPGIYAGITVSGGTNGITVNAGATDVVVLRGLAITGPGSSPVSTYGIRVMGSGTLHVEDCTISKIFLGMAIDGGDVHIRRVSARDSAGAITVIANSSTTHLISVTDSNLSHNAVTGLHVIASPPYAVDAYVTRVTAIGNGAQAFKAEANNAMAQVTMTIADSVATDNGTGFEVDGTGVTGNVSGSTLVRNTFADLSQQNNAILRTAGNNATTGGPNDVFGTLTPIGLK